MTPGARSIVFLVVVAGSTLVLDQVTKLWATEHLSLEREMRTRPACDPEGPVELRRVRTPGSEKVVIEDRLSFRYVQNCGGAWGLLAGTSEKFRYPFFLVVSVAAMVFILSLYRKVPRKQWMLRWALPFVLGGALGNFIDRIHMRYVVDFVLCHVSEGFDWPTFNVADMGISVGVGLLALDMIVGKKAQTKEGGSAEATDENAAVPGTDTVALPDPPGETPSMDADPEKPDS